MQERQVASAHANRDVRKACRTVLCHPDGHETKYVPEARTWETVVGEDGEPVPATAVDPKTGARVKRLGTLERLDNLISKFTPCGIVTEKVKNAIRQVKEHVQNGCLSDPLPVEDMYMVTCRQGRFGLPDYISKRGTSQLESWHKKINTIMTACKSNLDLLYCHLLFAAVVHNETRRVHLGPDHGLDSHCPWLIDTMRMSEAVEDALVDKHTKLYRNRIIRTDIPLDCQAWVIRGALRPGGLGGPTPAQLATAAVAVHAQGLRKTAGGVQLPQQGFAAIRSYLARQALVTAHNLLIQSLDVVKSARTWAEFLAGWRGRPSLLASWLHFAMKKGMEERIGENHERSPEKHQKADGTRHDCSGCQHTNRSKGNFQRGPPGRDAVRGLYTCGGIAKYGLHMTAFPPPRAFAPNSSSAHEQAEIALIDTVIEMAGFECTLFPPPTANETCGAQQLLWLEERWNAVTFLCLLIDSHRFTFPGSEFLASYRGCMQPKTAKMFRVSEFDLTVYGVCATLVSVLQYGRFTHP